MSSSALARGTTAVLEFVAKRRWGYSSRLMRPLVAQLGPLSALRWFACQMPRYECTRKIFGNVRTYLLCVAISLVNECHHCIYAYGYAIQLAYLNEHGRLFPVTEHEICQMSGLPPGVIRHRLIDIIQRA